MTERLSEGCDLYAVGTAIERVVDGYWFLARVVSIDKEHGCYTVVYLDDGHEEDDVPHDEVRRSKQPDSELPLSVDKAPPPLAPAFKLLEGFLAGEDNKAPECSPRVIVHRCGSVEDDENDTVRIINAPEAENIAVGLGIRGVRYLRKGTSGVNLETPREPPIERNASD